MAVQTYRAGDWQGKAGLCVGGVGLGLRFRCWFRA